MRSRMLSLVSKLSLIFKPKLLYPATQEIQIEVQEGAEGGMKFL